MQCSNVRRPRLRETPANFWKFLPCPSQSLTIKMENMNIFKKKMVLMKDRFKYCKNSRLDDVNSV